MASRLGMVPEDTYCPEPNISLGGNCILQILEAIREQPRVLPSMVASHLCMHVKDVRPKKTTATYTTDTGNTAPLVPKRDERTEERETGPTVDGESNNGYGFFFSGRWPWVAR